MPRFQQTRAQQYQQQHHAHDVARKSDRKHACDRASRTVHGNHQGELRGEARSSLARPSCFRAPRDIAMSRCGRAPGDA